MRRAWAAAVGATACLLVGACGQAGEPSTPAPASPAVTTPAVTTPAVTTPTVTTPTPASPASPNPTPSGPQASPAPATPGPNLGTAPDRAIGPAKPVTVTGTVTEGVEANCLVLNGYLLIGGRDQGVRAGAKVTVTGRTQPNLMTTCQQGTPLRVETVRPG